MGEGQDFVGSYLKQHDPDRYNASLMLPPAARNGVQALYAFNAEVSQIRDRVSEPTPGEIRLQWWVDLLEGTEHGDVQSNPIAQALLQTINQYDLPTTPLRRLLAARRFDLYDDPMMDLPSFEGYAGETNSILYQFGAMILNGGNDANAADAAGYLGVAHALIGHLSVLATTAGRGQLYLPLSIFTAHGAAEKDIFSGQATAQVQAACAQIREVATTHLDQADEEIVLLEPKIRNIFAPTVLLRHDLGRLEKFANIPFVTPPAISNLKKLLKLAWWTFKSTR